MRVVVLGCLFTQQVRVSDAGLKVKLPTKWTDEKAEVGRVREETRREEKRREEKRRSNKKRKSQKKSRESLCFPHDVWLRGRQ